MLKAANFNLPHLHLASPFGCSIRISPRALASGN